MIWIIWFTDFHGRDIFHDAFSSEELAKEALAKIDRQDRNLFKIEAHVLDGKQS